MAITGIGEYVPGSGRKQVRLTSGEVVSRQRAENLFAQKFGFATEYERKQAMKSAGYQSFVQRGGYQRAMAEARRHGTTKAEANAAFARFYSQEDENWRNRDRSPDGPLAQMLVAMGRRNASDTHFVGDSPSIH